MNAANYVTAAQMAWQMDRRHRKAPRPRWKVPCTVWDATLGWLEQPCLRACSRAHAFKTLPRYKSLQARVNAS